MKSRLHFLNSFFRITCYHLFWGATNQVFSFILLPFLIGCSQRSNLTEKESKFLSFETGSAEIRQILESVESLVQHKVKKWEVLEKAGEFYLLSQSLTKTKETLIYAIPLEMKNGRVEMARDQYLHACNCDELSLESFLFSKNEILGCKEHDHKLMSGPLAAR